MKNAEPAYRICPGCSYFCDTREEDQFCVRCGLKLIEVCPECNEAIDYPYSNFCKHCGHQIRKDAKNSVVTLYQPDKDQP